MRLNGEISEDIDDDDDKEEREEPEAEALMKACSIGDGGLFTLTQNLVVGYALTSKKKQSFLQPKLLSLARNKGIFFVAIDRSRPLSDQGPFDVVLHKVCVDFSIGKPKLLIVDTFLFSIDCSKTQVVITSIFLSFAPFWERDGNCQERNGARLSRFAQSKPMILISTGKHKMKTAKDWNLSCLNKPLCFVAQNFPFPDSGSFIFTSPFFLKFLKDYRLKHPEVTVLDPPYSIQHVYNRQSMLEDVPGINLPECYGRVGVPRQLVITKDPLSVPDEVNKAGLKLPLVAKPLIVDGTAKSHELFIAYDEFSLSNLEPPFVVQEFINHGGVLFKVYIIGETIKVVRRFSLPDVFNPELSKIAGVFRFPRVSSAAASAEDANLDPAVAGEVLFIYMNLACIAELPPTPLLERLAKELRHRLGLRLFNIDIIREHGTRDLYYVIDINYFPGK
ncbi:hypothetical protein RHGRI_032515 [Rhododendron griersonianum]|uniref:Inositol-1,3,4-trisphosphate 5/6-kinase n=1 Tax=Rhododendron griersonianum TaxID=479676 RepID=A0AAV6IC22_9ERIC|nr:hypothetical protein RHGRI_032515 [Rhododendron griersonianum]